MYRQLAKLQPTTIAIAVVIAFVAATLSPPSVAQAQDSPGIFFLRPATEQQPGALMLRRNSGEVIVFDEPLSDPRDLVIEPDGSVLVTDGALGFLVHIGPQQGQKQVIIQGLPEPDELFFGQGPDGQPALFTATHGDEGIWLLNLNEGTAEPVVTGIGIARAAVAAADGSFYVINEDGQTLHIVDGQPSLTDDTLPNPIALVAVPEGDNLGGVFACDAANNRVFRLTDDGPPLQIAEVGDPQGMVLLPPAPGTDNPPLLAVPELEGLRLINPATGATALLPEFPNLGGDFQPPLQGLPVALPPQVLAPPLDPPLPAQPDPDAPETEVPPATDPPIPTQGVPEVDGDTIPSWLWIVVLLLVLSVIALFMGRNRLMNRVAAKPAGPAAKVAQPPAAAAPVAAKPVPEKSDNTKFVAPEAPPPEREPPDPFEYDEDGIMLPVMMGDDIGGGKLTYVDPCKDLEAAMRKAWASYEEAATSAEMALPVAQSLGRAAEFAAEDAARAAQTASDLETAKGKADDSMSSDSSVTHEGETVDQVDLRLREEARAGLESSWKSGDITAKEMSAAVEQLDSPEARAARRSEAEKQHEEVDTDLSDRLAEATAAAAAAKAAAEQAKTEAVLAQAEYDRLDAIRRETASAYETAMYAWEHCKAAND